MSFKRIEPLLTEEYRKNPEDEQFVERLNDILASFEEQDYRDLEEKYPILHVIGVPRSGTTLLTQLICSRLDVGYINNLSAVFWKAPVFGIRLSNKLIPSRQSSFFSTFGRTSGMNEPHEFGYFWSSILGYQEFQQKIKSFEDTIDWKRLKLVLLNMAEAFGKPSIFKSFLLGWHIEKMQKILPKTCFIRIRRDPLQNAASILKLRKQYLGSVESWASLKPIEYAWLKDEPYWRQVAGQVYFLEKSFNKQIEKVNGRNFLDITYEQLCRSPKDILLQVKRLLTDNNSDAKIVSDPPSSFKVSLETKNLNSEDLGLLSKAIDEFYSGASG